MNKEENGNGVDKGLVYAVVGLLIGVLIVQGIGAYFDYNTAQRTVEYNEAMLEFSQAHLEEMKAEHTALKEHWEMIQALHNETTG